MQSETLSEPDYSKVKACLDRLQAACTEIKSLTNPPRQVVNVVQGLLVFINYPTGDWITAKKSFANITVLIQTLHTLKKKIDRGDDFSQGIKHADQLFKDPENSPDSIKRKSAAAGTVVEYL